MAPEGHRTRRHGDRKVNLWRGGGVTAGPRRDRNYLKRMPKKMRRSALRSALTAKAAGDRIVVLERLTVKAPKTKTIQQLLRKLDAEGNALILLPDKDDNVWLSARNLPGVKAMLARNLNLRDLLSHEWLVMPRATISVLEEMLGGGDA
ncbi:MAG: 50S ribosomal protein L4 [Anaerolineae bacterium]